MTFSAALISVLETADSVCVLTGAGVSAESGVPTFRGAEGLWSKFKPEELANLDAFMRNPELVWEWYTYRKNVMHSVAPNPAHYALVQLEKVVSKFTLVTQNVDGLHRRAGNRNVLELHGNIERSYCMNCGMSAAEVRVDESHKVPRCPHCGGLLRPDVVWFGEILPQEVFVEAERAASACDLFLCIGTSAVVYPAAALPLTARRSGAYVVEINTERTDLSSRIDEVILGKAGEVMPDLVHHLQQKRKISQ